MRAGMWLALLLLTTAGSAALANDACVNPAPPVAAPTPGTPRAEYCDAVDGSVRWVVLAAVPVIAGTIGVVALRRRPRAQAAVVLAIIMAAFVNALVVGSLEYATTI